MGTGAAPIVGYEFSYTQGFAAGSANREDLLDLITNLSPWDTPFYSSAPKVDCKHTTHEWLIDSLSATATGGAFEGGGFSAEATIARTRLLNNTQIFRRDIAVADTQRAVNPAGIRDEYEYQVMKATKEIARNIEARIFAVSATVVSSTGATGAARTFTGLRGFALQSGSISGTITVAGVTDLHETMFTNGSDPDTLYVSPGVKADFTTALFASTNARSINLSQGERKIIQNVDVFESDFGLLAVVPDRFIPQGSTTDASGGFAAFLVERARAKIATLRPVKHVPLGKDGDATRGIVVGELTLQIDHPSAHGQLRNVTT